METIGVRPTDVRWLPIAGWEHYSVSDNGLVFSVRSQTILLAGLCSKGYPRVILWDGPTSKGFSVHQLVAMMFVDNPDPAVLNQVNHIDCDKENNDYTNLEWVDQSTNLKHAFANGMRRDYTGSENPAAKLTEDDVKLIRLRLAAGISQRKIATEFGVNKTSIGRISRGILWKHVV